MLTNQPLSGSFTVIQVNGAIVLTDKRRLAAYKAIKMTTSLVGDIESKISEK